MKHCSDCKFCIDDRHCFGDSEKSNAAIAALCCATKIIAKHNLLEENFYSGIDVSSLSDDDLKHYAAWLHIENLFADRELSKRNLS